MIREAFKEEDCQKNESQIALMPAMTPADWKKYKKEARKERNYQERKEQKKFQNQDGKKIVWQWNMINIHPTNRSHFL